MARLPSVGADDGVWGDILNQFLLVAHDVDGTIKANAVSVGAIPDGSITEVKLASAVQTKLNGGGVAGVSSVNTRTGAVTLDKTDVGLANVDNTSDANKPVSSATQTALNLKANTSSLAAVATSGSYTDLTNKPTIPNITVASSAPSSPSVGDIWIDTSA